MNRVFVRRKTSETTTAPLILQPGKNLRTGEGDFAEEFGALTTLERDLMLIAASIFAADRSTARGERENQNRSIKIEIPVVNTTTLLPVKIALEDILRTLSHDYWTIDFRQEKGSVESFSEPAKDGGTTLLFSGGLDSLAGAIEFGTDQRPLHLVSHVTRNRQTRDSQSRLYEFLKTAKFNVRHSSFFVSATSSAPSADVSFSVENSQRTRSFLFATLGALVARRQGNRRILFVAENGQLAIHLPLNPARAGAFSTHTAHPDVLGKMERFFSTVLGVDLKIVNPYQHKTKAEVVGIVQAALPGAIEVSVSCWMNAHLPKGVTHCGYCIPCIIRRIAIETHRVDGTSYRRDLFSEKIPELPPSDDGRRNLYDFIEFNYEIGRLSATEISDKWPEVITVPHSSAVIEMYKRAALESRKVLESHPATAQLIR
jgi:7-cyano-7-deazaguanine synthase in queuosine biosynthesis